ncbi:probable Na(+)/H(+) antiporter nhx-9 [Haliotis asinina]|uniref:probable Na(+)/H(+) antiporter nhx-9 n=1 Tax=Haliotis asinina TaxID=109174 RepID=UPI003531941A
MSKTKLLCTVALGASALSVVPGVLTAVSADEGEKGTTNETERYPLVNWDFDHVEIPYVICLWILLASVAKMGFHLYDRLSSLFPESCLLITLGICVGVTLHYSHAASTSQYVLNANTFFLFILPPIIYDAGYHMPNRAFFNNLGTILLLAIVNTLWNTVAIGVALWGCSAAGWIKRPISMLHCFVFSALISAVDPVAVLAVFEEIHVNEMLYIIVFGESLLNDGVTVVVYHMMEGYTEIGESNIQIIDYFSGIGSFFIIALGGTLIGIIYGLIGGFITKHTGHVKVIEPLFVFILGYLAYLSAEMLHWSGILALTFGGITMRHYVEANMSKQSVATVKYFLKMLANISETIIFMFLGLSTVIDDHDWQLDFIFFSILFCLVFRVTGIVMLSALVNRTRLIKLSKIDQFIMSYGGLRGGIAFCLALLLNEEVVTEKRMFVTTTIIVVFFTVFLQGITIKPVVNALKIEKAKEIDPTMNERIHERFIDHLMAGIEDVVGRTGHNSIRDKFEHYNTKYIKPLLLREKPKTRETKIFQVFTKLNLRDAMDHIETHGNFSPVSIPAEPSLAKVIRSYSVAESVNTVDSDPPVDTSKTVLDMQSVHAVYNEKLADAGHIHHVLEDAMFRTRKTWVKDKKYSLAEVRNHPPFRHKERYQLRRLISQAYKTRRGTPQNGTPSMVEPQSVKAVTFSNETKPSSEQPAVDQFTNSLMPAQESTTSNKVVFSVGSSSNLEGGGMSPMLDADQKVPVEETAVERTLPWKRISTDDIVPSLTTLIMADDEKPLMSEAPSWVSNPSYHNLLESGSPYVSPQTTLTAPPEQTHTPSVFEIFQANVCQKVEAKGESPVVAAADIKTPNPWDLGGEEEPIASPISIQNGDKTNNLLHSAHSVFPPPHHVIIPGHLHRPPQIRKSLSLPGKASSPQSPKHWQPIEMQDGNVYRKCPSEAEIIFDEVAYQQDVKSRVSEWLQHTDDSEPEEYDGIQVNFSNHECATNGFEIDSGEESDIEMTYL